MAKMKKKKKKVDFLKENIKMPNQAKDLRKLTKNDSIAGKKQNK